MPKEITAISFQMVLLPIISNFTTISKVIQEIQEEALRLPDDVADNAHADPPLTTVRVRKRKIGILVARRLHEPVNRRDDRPTCTIVYSQLVIRDSCGAHRAPATDQTFT